MKWKKVNLNKEKIPTARRKKNILWHQILLFPCRNVSSYFSSVQVYEINHFRFLILSASTFTEEEEKIAVMIRFLSTLVHRKERKAGLFRSYVDFWKLGSICLWFASARTCVRACVRVCVRVCVCTCACSCVCVCLVISNSLGSHGL